MKNCALDNAVWFMFLHIKTKKVIFWQNKTV